MFFPAENMGLSTTFSYYVFQNIVQSYVFWGAASTPGGQNTSTMSWHLLGATDRQLNVFLFPYGKTESN